MLLCLPFTYTGESPGFLNHLFIAVSAVSTTGLATVSTSDTYNFFGELVILIGIQAGGLGYMTIGSFLLLASRSNLSPTRVRLGRSVFGLPASFHLPTFVRRIVIYTVALEAAGAILLWWYFRDAEDVENPLWSGVFHSVSAFCTAGFSLFGDSLEGFRGHLGINIVISLLSLSGAIGFLVVNDLFDFVRRKKKSFTLTSKIILVSTFGMTLFGALGLYLFEPSIRELGAEERILASWFQSMTSLTTVGFNTHAISALSPAVVLLVTMLMILGASPCGTGGGLKSTTWSAGFAVLISSLRNRSDVMLFGKAIPQGRLLAAFAAIVLYVICFTVGGFLLLVCEPGIVYEDLLFEQASALGTVGISRGITGDLGAPAKWIVIVTMFLGRTGPVTIGVALAALLKSAGELDGQTMEEDVIV